MSDTIGNTLREARLARDLSIEDAARAIKIKPGRISDLEQDDYSNFPTIVYAKGFLTLYAKFLNVDIDTFLHEFGHNGEFGIEGYDYLNENSYGYNMAKRKPRSPLPALALLTTGFIVAVILVGGVWFVLSSLKRLEPSTESITAQETDATATALLTPPKSTPTPPPSPTPAIAATPHPTVTAPSTTLKTAKAIVIKTPAPEETISVARAVAVQPSDRSTPPAPASTTISEPTVRRAVAVNSTASQTTPPPATTQYQLEVRAITRAWARIVINHNQTKPAFEGWLTPGEMPLKLNGSQFSIILLDLGSIEILKNGKKVYYESTAFSIE